MKTRQFRKVYTLVFCLLGLLSCGGKQNTGLSISGTIIASVNAVADQDTQDPNAPKIDNSSLDSAQSLSNPGTAGGNVNLTTDALDYYQVFLNARDGIVLQTADAGNEIQISLLLRDVLTGLYTPVSSNNAWLPLARNKQLTAIKKGDYLIKVEAINGASNYRLSVGSPGQALNLSLASTVAKKANLDNVIAGDILLRFKETVSGIQIQRNTDTLFASNAAHRITASSIMLGGVVHLKIEPKTIVSGANISAPKISVQETLAIIRQLQQRPDVLYAEPNYRHHAFLVQAPNDPFYSEQWNLPNINLPEGWKQATVGSPVTVAVLDSGILFNHPDLIDRFIIDKTYSTGFVGFDFIRDPLDALDGDGLDDDPTDPGSQFQIGSIYHGTLVSGVIAANTHNATGISGVANTADIRLLPLRIIGNNGGTSADICQAIQFASGLITVLGKRLATPVDLINMSFGSQSFSQTVHDCIQQARAQGVLIIAAAGNDASNVLMYPASYDGVISVSATTLDKKRAFYSNTGSAIDIAAPGGDVGLDINADGKPDGILTTSASTGFFGGITYGYRYATGTSMAAPHIVGVLALMKWIYPALTPELLDQWLAAGFLTDDLDPQAANPDLLFGYGLINALSALTQAQKTAGGSITLIPPLLSATPRRLNFGATIDSLSVNISNAGTGVLSTLAPAISYAQNNVSWLSITLNIDANGLGVYTLHVDRQALTAGNYEATLSFSSTRNVLDIPISMSIPRIDINANTGFLYVLLTDANSDAVFRTNVAQAKNGQYDFVFANVRPGQYQIYAGTDMDNDKRICDNGEACGAYATLNRLINIQVSDQSISGIKMRTGFMLDTGFFQSQNYLSP